MEGKPVAELTSETFDSETNNGICVIDFWAPWCGPCKMIEPVIKSLAKSMGTGKVAKVNIDSEPSIARRFHIRSVPTIIIMKDGGVERKMTGNQSLQSLVKEVRAIS